MSNLTLPTDSAERKNYPIYDGALAYFPAAISGVAYHSLTKGAKHTGGRLVHKRGLSGDHASTIIRHLVDLHDMIAALRRKADTVNPGFSTLQLLDEANALSWRALALSQELHEVYGGAPLAPAAELE